MKIVCVACHVELSVAHNGVTVVEMFGDPPQPYKLWASDVLECPECHAQIAVAIGRGPIAQHHDDDFDLIFTQAKTKRIVYDYERKQ